MYVYLVQRQVESGYDITIQVFSTQENAERFIAEAIRWYKELNVQDNIRIPSFVIEKKLVLA